MKLLISIALVVICVFTFSSMVHAQTISNIVVQSGEQYTVEQDSLVNAELVYIDRSYTFQSIPVELIGATYIKTANSDKRSISDQFVIFTVDVAVNVYISHDDRITYKPSWLSTWLDTDWDLVTNDAGFDVFVKSFAAGPVMLGGNEGGKSSSMYSIAVVASDINLWPGPLAGVLSVSAVCTEITEPDFINLTFMWNASSRADGYRLFSREPGHSYNYDVPDWEGQHTTCVLLDLPIHEDRYFVVRAYNNIGESDDSNEVLYEGEL